MKYIGSELELFSEAINWKSYFSEVLDNYVSGDVLEVGAGIGETTKFLYNSKVTSWDSLEPDSEFTNLLKENEFYKKNKISVFTGTSKNLESYKKYDTILYIDVLEHIEDDKSELEKISGFLKDDGKVIVLSPAHNFLFSPFDESVGHFRRYDKAGLLKSTPSCLKLQRSIYLDSLGVLLSFVNMLLLKQSMPKKSQINFWDKVVVPISKILDRIIFFNAGKTIVGIWKLQKNVD